MLGEYKLAVVPEEDLSADDLLMGLQIKIAHRYTVHPVEARRAYLELASDDGMCHRVVFRTFMYRVMGKANLKEVALMCDEAFKAVCATFPADATVAWRLRPALEEKDITEVCPECGQTKEPPLFATYLRMRLGCVGQELVTEQPPYHLEGFLIKNLPGEPK